MTETKELVVDQKQYQYWAITDWLSEHQQDIQQYPYTIRVLLEMALRHNTLKPNEPLDLKPFLNWNEHHDQDVAFKPERVILQDFTGVPALVDLAAMRDKVAELKGNPAVVNPEVPVHLVIDHSVQVDQFGTNSALAFNQKKEFERNQERYQFLKWAQGAFDNLTVIPPDTGIIHQINLELLATVIATKKQGGKTLAFPDTVVGTDSHTTMVNSLGVLGWGVGGIEAEASMLGEQSYFPMPKVVGVKLTGELPTGTTATDLALTVTNLLRKHQVVGKFVEFYGSGLAQLPIADRATIANMSPEYGATCGFFPIDAQTLAYLKLTNRSQEQLDLIQAYAEANGLLYDSASDDQRVYSETVTLDLSTIQPSVAGPSRPQDLVHLADLPAQFAHYQGQPTLDLKVGAQDFQLKPGAVGIAAITSCTNTSNPAILLTAGLIAKRAVEKGLSVPAYVKTSLAPGSKVVTDYLAATNLQPALDQLGFNIVGYGCTTCIGNSGELQTDVQKAVAASDFPMAAVESGNRNFEGRVNPLIKDTYLASPPLVVAYALAGRLDIDLTTQPLGYDQQQQPVYLKDLWPSANEVAALQQTALKPERFAKSYTNVLSQNPLWNALSVPTGQQYTWDPNSTYIAAPTFFKDLSQHELTTQHDLTVLAKFGDTITTDHISPAGFIGPDTPAGKYLAAKGIAPRDFNSYGSRRGNHHVMVRGTLANIRIQNQLTPDKVGGFTKYWPTDTTTTIYDAAQDYEKTNTPLIILAGKDYGMGSSRDWAAKGVALLGVKAVLAESFERIHRSNLVMMGILPLQFLPGENATSLGLTGQEKLTLTFDADNQVTVTAVKPDQSETTFKATLRFDTPADQRYYQAGGILPLVLKDKLAGA
jgi:aconitate hydratase